MLQIGYTVGKCPDYIEGGETREVTIVIGPLRVFEDITRDGKTSYEVIVGCNMHFYCGNGKCIYSKVSRDERRKQREASPIRFNG